MSEIWYNNPKILFDNFLEVLPINNISRDRKINSLVRLAIYLFILIILFNINSISWHLGMCLESQIQSQWFGEQVHQWLLITINY